MGNHISNFTQGFRDYAWSCSILHKMLLLINILSLVRIYFLFYSRVFLSPYNQHGDVIEYFYWNQNPKEFSIFFFLWIQEISLWIQELSCGFKNYLVDSRCLRITHVRVLRELTFAFVRFHVASLSDSICKSPLKLIDSNVWYSPVVSIMNQTNHVTYIYSSWKRKWEGGLRPFSFYINFFIMIYP